MTLFLYKILLPFSVLMEKSFSTNLNEIEKVFTLLNSGHIIGLRLCAEKVYIKPFTVHTKFDFEISKEPTQQKCYLKFEDKVFWKRTTDSFCIEIFGETLDTLKNLEKSGVISRIDNKLDVIV